MLRVLIRMMQMAHASCSRKSACFVPCDQNSIAAASVRIEMLFIERKKLPTNTILSIF